MDQFQYDFTHEYYGGKLLNTGDDIFITRWMLANGHHSCVQNVLDAEITTTVMEDRTLLWQMVRWQKNAFKSFKRTLKDDPGFWALCQ
jgi:hypothetical protein